jgi:cellobiose phosphorylase
MTPPDEYGYFDDAAREYVVSRPDTPLPWANYLGTEDYIGIVTNTGGGYAFYRDARLRRLTRYRYNNVPADTGGRYVYVRDDDSGDFWTPTWLPVRADLDDYTCRHGLGYTRIAARRGGVAASVLYFVPLGEDLEVWRVSITNERDRPARVSLFSAVEWCLWDAWDDATNFQRNLSTGEVVVDDRAIFHVTEYRERRNHFAYFACSEPLAGFDTQRDAFLGPHRGWDRPGVVEAGRSSASVAHGWAPCGSHHVALNLSAGESREVIFTLGYWENPPDAKFRANGAVDTSRVWPVIERHLDVQALDIAFDELARYWAALLDRVEVATPDEHVDRMVNVWNAYQCMVTFNLSRSASLFESGIGRGMGFRDCCQDLLGFVHMVPDRARARLLDIAATQLPTGGAYHQYQPLTKRGNDAIGSGFNDDPLWLVLAVAAYLDETGDDALLDEAVTYDGTPGSESPLYEHLRRAVQYTLDRRGPHGLPLIGRADWNDCLNLNCFSEQPGEPFQTTENRAGGAAESVFIAGLFVIAARKLATIADRRGADAEGDAVLLRAEADGMGAAVLAHGWDGAWFLRAYDYFGDVVGSAANDEGAIFIEPQGMCVLAGIGIDDGRARKALDSVASLLATPHGIMLVQPSYRRYHVELGEISSYPPGYKENGGIFCHTNPWIVIAETLLDDGDQALDYHLRINPSARAAASALHGTEPYVYAQMIAGRDAPDHGAAKNSWLTGTAAWSFVAITQWVLGIRPDHDGLRIDPCLPAAWQGFTARRVFRGATYDIRVRKPLGAHGRVQRLRVDGVEMAGNLVPVAADGAAVTVEATIEA